MSGTTWRKTPCDSTACVEIGRTDYGDFAIRSSQFRADKVIVTRRELESFINACKVGHFDTLIYPEEIK